MARPNLPPGYDTFTALHDNPRIPFSREWILARWKMYNTLREGADYEGPEIAVHQYGEGPNKVGVDTEQFIKFLEYIEAIPPENAPPPEPALKPPGVAVWKVLRDGTPLVDFGKAPTKEELEPYGPGSFIVQKTIGDLVHGVEHYDIKAPGPDPGPVLLPPAPGPGANQDIAAIISALLPARAAFPATAPPPGHYPPQQPGMSMSDTMGMMKMLLDMRTDAEQSILNMLEHVRAETTDPDMSPTERIVYTVLDQLQEYAPLLLSKLKGNPQFAEVLENPTEAGISGLVSQVTKGLGVEVDADTAAKIAGAVGSALKENQQ